MVVIQLSIFCGKKIHLGVSIRQINCLVCVRDDTNTPSVEYRGRSMGWPIFNIGFNTGGRYYVPHGDNTGLAKVRTSRLGYKTQ